MITPDEIFRYISKQPRHIAGYKQILHDLGIRGKDRRPVEQLLRDLTRQKKLVAIGKERWGLPTSASSQDLVVGRLHMHRDGYGFVTPEPDSLPPRARGKLLGDVFIPPPDIGNAMHGDQVLVELGRIRPDGKGDGRILRVTEREQERVVGIFHYGPRHNYVKPFDEKIGMEIIIPPGMEYPSAEDEEQEEASSRIPNPNPNERSDVRASGEGPAPLLSRGQPRQHSAHKEEESHSAHARVAQPRGPQQARFSPGGVEAPSAVHDRDPILSRKQGPASPHHESSRIPSPNERSEVRTRGEGPAPLPSGGQPTKHSAHKEEESHSSQEHVAQALLPVQKERTNKGQEVKQSDRSAHAHVAQALLPVHDRDSILSRKQGPAPPHHVSSRIPSPNERSEVRTRGEGPAPLHSSRQKAATQSPSGSPRLRGEKEGHLRQTPHRVLGDEAQKRTYDDLENLVVEVEIIQFPSATHEPRGRVVEILGYEDDFGVDVEIMIRKHHIRHVFPQAVLEEAQEISPVIPPQELARRRDFRNLPIVTIDGETARDFDDAVLVRRLPSGHYELQVHIADVAQYVEDGSAIDEEARKRGTSVYFPDRAVPMLPLELSTDICSLRPNLDRLVLSCIMELDRQGEIVSYDLAEGVIRSAHRMTYTDVNAIIEGDTVLRDKYPDMVSGFELMYELAQVLNRKRAKRGSIDFDLPEPVIEFDEHGLMKSVTPSERNWAYRLIEEFMLAANETVATHLEQRHIASLYRIHEKPDPKRIFEFEQIAASFGYSLGVGALPIKRVTTRADKRSHYGSGRRAPVIELPEEVHITPRMYQKLVSKITGKAEERVLSYLMLRSLKQARYSEINEGHFALAAPTYTHFTSPIRRYPDLIVHRILKDVLREHESSQVSPSGGQSQTRVAQTLLSVHGRHSKGTEYEKTVPPAEDRVAQPPSAVHKKQYAPSHDSDVSDLIVAHEHPIHSQHLPFTFSTSEHSPWSKRKLGHGDKPPQKGSSSSPRLRGEKMIAGEKEVPGLPLETLHDIADSSSQSERAADEAERELMEWKKLKFMETRLGEDFDGLIVNVMKYGFFVELTELFIEGLVPIDTLENDLFTYRENTRQIIGQRSGKIFSIGDRVRVLADRIDHVQRKIQFALVPDEAQKKSKPSRAQKRHKKRH